MARRPPALSTRIQQDIPSSQVHTHTHTAGWLCWGLWLTFLCYNLLSVFCVCVCMCMRSQMSFSVSVLTVTLIWLRLWNRLTVFLHALVSLNALTFPLSIRLSACKLILCCLLGFWTPSFLCFPVCSEVFGCVPVERNSQGLEVKIHSIFFIEKPFFQWKDSFQPNSFNC